MLKVINNQTFVKLIDKLFEKWKYFLLVALIGGLAGLYYAVVQKPKFESTLTFALENEENGVSETLRKLAQINYDFNLKSEMFSGDNVLQIIKSREVIEKALLSTDTINNRNTTLAEYYFEHDYKKIKIETANFPCGIKEQNLTPVQRQVLYDIYIDFSESALSVQRIDKFLSIFRVSVVSSNERFCKSTTERLIAQTDSFYRFITTKKGEVNLKTLENRVTGLRQLISENVTAKALIKDKNINPALQATEAPAQKIQSSIDVYQMAYSEEYKNLELLKFLFTKEQPLMQIIDSPDYPMKNLRIGKLVSFFWFAYLAMFAYFFFIVFVEFVKFFKRR